MADIFKKANVRKLLKGKHILFIGDSNIRALYKDLVWLCKMDSLIGLQFLKRRLEGSFLGDKLLDRSELTRGRDFTEHRIFENNEYTIQFLFVTRCYCDNLVKLFTDIKEGRKRCPDAILMNSCLWDVSRWGPNGVNEYKENMQKLMKLIENSLPNHVLFIWGTALPIASSTSGGLIIKQIEFLQAILRIHVVEANAFTSALVSSCGYDVLDFHYYMRYQIIRRSADGIHFLPPAMRFLTNLLLTHIALSWDIELPGNLKTYLSPLSATIMKAIEPSSRYDVQHTIKKIELIANNLNKSCLETPSRKKKKKKNRNKIYLTSDETQFKVNNVKNPNYIRPSIKTPPYYHKASTSFCYQIPASETFETNIECYNNEVGWSSYQNNNNMPNSDDYQNISSYDYFDNHQYDRPMINDSLFSQLPAKDFRLLGFHDFDQSRNSYEMSNFWETQSADVNDRNYFSRRGIGSDFNNEHPEFINYYNNNLPPIAVTVYNTNYSNDNRYPNYRSHPYKSGRPYHNHNRHAWCEVDDYQYDPGPMRYSHYRYRHEKLCSKNWY